MFPMRSETHFHRLLFVVFICLFVIFGNNQLDVERSSKIFCPSDDLWIIHGSGSTAIRDVFNSNKVISCLYIIHDHTLHSCSIPHWGPCASMTACRSKYEKVCSYTFSLTFFNVLSVFRKCCLRAASDVYFSRSFKASRTGQSLS